MSNLRGNIQAIFLVTSDSDGKGVAKKFCADLHVDSVFRGAVNGPVQSESDDEDFAIDHEPKSIARAAVAPTTLGLTKAIHYLFLPWDGASEIMSIMRK